MWQELVKLMQTVQAHYEAMRDLAERKRVLLVTVKLKELEGLIAEEERLASILRVTEKKRQELLFRLAQTIPGVTEKMKLSALVQLCPSPVVAKDLQAVAKRLDKLVEEVRYASERNALLLESALDAVQRRLQVLGGASVDPTYGTGGKEKVLHEKKFDFRA